MYNVYAMHGFNQTTQSIISCEAVRFTHVKVADIELEFLLNN